jgi:Major Facilitator Superfamily.
MSLDTVKKQTPKVGLILLVFLAFISLGLPDGLLGVAWPSIRANFKIPLDSLGMLLFAATAGYATSSFFSGKIIAHLGVGGVLAASCGLTGLGLIGYTLVPVWGLMVALGVVAGLGAGAIDSGLNTYVASNFKESLMQWMHACYGIGITMGPIIMTTGLNLLKSWRIGYVVVGVAQLALGLSFLFSLKMWKRPNTETETAKQITDYKTPFLETLRQPGAWISILLFFIYTGCEAALGTWVYTLLTQSRHVATAIAGYLVSSYWVTFTIGRALAGLYTKRIKMTTLLTISIGVAVAGTVLLLVNISNTVSVIGVAIIGFAIAPIFPGLVSDTSSRVGPRHAANTIGMQMGGGSIGAATIPTIIGILAQHISLESIPVTLLVFYLLLFGLFLLSLVYRAKPTAEAAK